MLAATKSSPNGLRLVASKARWTALRSFSKTSVTADQYDVVVVGEFRVNLGNSVEFDRLTLTCNFVLVKVVDLVDM